MPLVVSVAPLKDNFEFWRRFSRLAAGVASALGALARSLAAIGIFGVMSTVVVRRTPMTTLRYKSAAATRSS
jgi:hypothetical protein